MTRYITLSYWLLQECFLLILCLIFKDHIASATFISYQICCSLSRTFFKFVFESFYYFQTLVLRTRFIVSKFNIIFIL
ncbi:hypothetical protein CBN_A0061 [Clostridium botulinum NCTC 2916]|nr:hypothetical protein CBN_A0061 [Clostridium botulinum NCTC 2916]